MHAGTRDGQAIGLWSDAQRRRLVALCASISGDRSAAEDLAQETLLEAWRNRHKLHDPAGADRWLAEIARNVCRRWARRAGRAPVAVLPQEVADLPGDHLAVELDLERAELAELLDRALALLPAATRAVLVDRFVHESPHAEIAARHGLSVDAVSMRISRGKLVLRALFESQLQEEAAAYGIVSSAGGWRETRLWCENCGRCRLLMRREPAPGAVSFRCPGCSPDPAALTSRLSLANPYFARLVGDLVRPTAIAARTSAWVHSYYSRGVETGQVVCTRCSRRVVLRRLAADDLDRPGEEKAQPGLLAVCGACGEAVSSSLHGLALALPEVQLLRRSHRRLRFLPDYEVEHRGVDATVVPIRSAASSARVDAVFARTTLRLLSVHGPTG